MLIVQTVLPKCCDLVVDKTGISKKVKKKKKKKKEK